MEAGRLCKVFVEGHGEDPVVEHDKKHYDHDREDGAQQDLSRAECEDRSGSEETAADVSRDVGGRREDVHKHVTECK